MKSAMTRYSRSPISHILVEFCLMTTPSSGIPISSIIVDALDMVMSLRDITPAPLAGFTRLGSRMNLSSSKRSCGSLAVALSFPLLLLEEGAGMSVSALPPSGLAEL